MDISKIKLLLVFLMLLPISAGPQSGGRKSSQACQANGLVSSLLTQTSQETWTLWIGKLSGAELVQSGGAFPLIQSRNTGAMARGEPYAQALDYVSDKVSGWHPEEWIVRQAYPFVDEVAANLIMDLPGQLYPDEYVLLTAHLDDTSWNSVIAPGANDNATGSATLLEAARLLRRLRFEKTIRLVWFTGEEQGLLGSRAYVDEFALQGHQAVVNMDMFGWDGDGDRCFEIASGSLTGSQEIGACFAETIAAYGLGLTYDFNSPGASDHIPFWENGVPAIGVFENAHDNPLPGGCSGADRNPYYHLKEDTLALNVTPSYAFDIARAGLATIAALARPVEACFNESPQLTASGEPPGEILLRWDSVPGASAYRVYRSSFGCEQDWQGIGVTTALDWADADVQGGWPYQYQVEAVSPDGACVSPPSNCVSIGPPPPPVFEKVFLPAIHD